MICGGAYFAGEKVIWQGNQLPMIPLKLYSGTAMGPVNEIVAYPDFGMCKVNIVNATHPITQLESESLWVLYYWGPVLIPSKNTQVAILGRYEGGNQVAMLAFEYGRG